MTTDAHRAFARQHAAAIYQHHLNVNGRAGCDANHIASTIDYQETLYRGLLAECDFAVKFRVRVNREILQHGDGGINFRLPCLTRGGVALVPINIKSKSVLYGGWDGWQRMIAKGTHLRVPVREVKPRTIYVLGVYLVGYDTATVERWTWGDTLIARNERMNFETATAKKATRCRFRNCASLMS